MFKVRLLSSIVLMILMLFFVITGGNVLLAATAFLSLVAMIIGKLIFVFGADTQVTAYLTMAMFMIVEISLYNGVFNLLPIPPFDGSRVFFSFLPNKIYFGIMKYERYIMYGMLFLFYTGILSLPFGFISNAIYAGLDIITGFIC